MRMADQEDLDISEFESKRFDTFAKERHTGFEIAVDENVTFGSGDQITRNTFGPDVIKIARDAKRRVGRGPVVNVLVAVG
jgi:hypothetical protein